MAVPGSVVAVGKLITPGGQQGPPGVAGSTAALADVTQNGLLRQTPGTTTTFVDGTNNYQLIVPQITAVRLRSYNSVQNCNFEIDQRSVGLQSPNPPNALIPQDRWGLQKVGTMVISVQQLAAGVSGTTFVPGTNFRISNNYQTASLTTQQASLGAGDLWAYTQIIEGPTLREMIGDVTSISLLVSSSVAGLKFSVALRDPTATTKSLVKLCTIPSASTWTLIQLPNIPVFPSGNFSLTPGVAGYQFSICLACGTTFTAPAADTWQNGNFLGAPGMDNFASKPVNSLFQVAFVQHEPGSICTTFQDKPFSQNLDEALRYYQKTYDYGTVPGSASVSLGARGFVAPVALASAYGTVSFHKPMAKTPTITLYAHTTGAAGSVVDGGGVLHTGAAAANVGQYGFPNITFTTATTAGMVVWSQFVADTGW